MIDMIDMILLLRTGLPFLETHQFSISTPTPDILSHQKFLVLLSAVGGFLLYDSSYPVKTS